MRFSFFRKKTKPTGDIIRESVVVEPSQQEGEKSPAPPSVMLLVETEKEPQFYELPNDSDFKIGRNPRNDLCLDDPEISDFHAKIIPVKGSYVLRDLLSGSGVKVNHKKIHECRLRFGDRIEIGANALIFDLKKDYRRGDEFFAGKEKRKAVRISPPLTLRFVVYSKNRAEEFSASIKDISLEGAGIEIEKRLPKGSMIEAQVYSSELDTVDLIGTVVREKGFERDGKIFNEVGIQFLEMDEESRERLKDYLIKCIS